MNKVEYFTDLAKSIEKDERRMNDDTISRQAAIDAIDRAVTKEAARWSLQELPSAERRGRWIDVNGDESVFKCSACGEISCCNNLFCGDCGARMNGEEK